MKQVFQVWHGEGHGARWIETFRDYVDARTYAEMRSREEWITARRTGHRETTRGFAVVQRYLPE